MCRHFSMYSKSKSVYQKQEFKTTKSCIIRLGLFDTSYKMQPFSPKTKNFANGSINNLSAYSINLHHPPLLQLLPFLSQTPHVQSNILVKQRCLQGTKGSVHTFTVTPLIAKPTMHPGKHQIYPNLPSSWRNHYAQKYHRMDLNRQTSPPTQS